MNFQDKHLLPFFFLIVSFHGVIGFTLPSINVASNEIFEENAASENEIMNHLGCEEPLQEAGSSVWNFAEHFAGIWKAKSFLSKIGGKIETVAECLSCRFAVSFMQHYVRSGASEKEVGAVAYKICTVLKIETPRVCSGVTKLFRRELTQVFSKVVLNPKEICGFLYQDCGSAVNPLHDWTVPLTPFPKPPVIQPQPPKPESPVLHVLHISDVHIDPYYKEGTKADCGEPLCCRAASGNPDKPEDGAGYWGDYRNCDIPLHTLENMLAHINRTHTIDYVIWTGDIPPHDIWNNSRKEAINLLHSVSQVVHSYFGDIPVFPALGNHESSPVNSFPIPLIKGNESISWLYEEVAKAWKPWLPYSSDTLRKGAYYTVPVFPGFRIISLNMNYCNSLNWWLLINSTDPTDQLAWLVVQLQMAEDKGEKVHIIGHIPPGEPDCLGVWSKNFNKIVNRYESTITGQFYGHTHTDEFEIFYEKIGSKKRATNVAYVGPSVTTYDSVNPGYRIYTIDGNYANSSWAILDHSTYYTNLTDSNLYGPKWKFEYSAKDAYNMNSLLPRDWDLLTKKFEEDDSLFNTFYRYFYKLSDSPRPKCDGECKKIFICRLRRSQSNDPLVC